MLWFDRMQVFFMPESRDPRYIHVYTIFSNFVLWDMCCGYVRFHFNFIPSLFGCCVHVIRFVFLFLFYLFFAYFFFFRFSLSFCIFLSSAVISMATILINQIPKYVTIHSYTLVLRMMLILRLLPEFMWFHSSFCLFF